MIHYYVLDTETNGLNIKYHEICEISIIRASDRTQLTRQVRVDNIEGSSFDALRIIKKSMSDLAKGVSKIEAITDFEKFVNEDNVTPEHRCLVGHNVIAFDRRFLCDMWEKQGKEFPFTLYLDTMHMLRAFAKKYQIIKPKMALGAACDILQVQKVPGEHEAIADTRNCYLLWERLRNEVEVLDHIKRLPHKLDEEDPADNDAY